MKIKMKIKILYIIFGLFSLIACLDEIELEIPKGQEDGLVIQGEIIKGTPSTLRVQTSRIFNFDLSTLTRTSGRAVKLFDDAGNELEIKKTATGVFSHIFSPDDPIQIEFGRSYHIEVSTLDGRVFKSVPEKLMPLPEGKPTLDVERSTFERLDQNNRLREFPALTFKVNASIEHPTLDQNLNLLWKAERTYQITDSAFVFDFVPKTCYTTVQLDFDKIHVLDGQTVLASEIEGFPLSKVVYNFEFYEGYYYTIYQRSLTEGAFTYWDQTRQSIDRDGGLFETPAGRVPSNFVDVENPDEISVDIYGYFTAYAQDTARLYIEPQFFYTSPERYCPRMPNESGPCPVSFCCDCLDSDGSQLEKPDFWK